MPGHIILILNKQDFQYKYSSTYRLTDNDYTNSHNFNDIINVIKKKHQNFHHFAKNLREAIEVFGKVYALGQTSRVYHGINQEMLFNSMSAYIFGPFSTTCDDQVALNFATNNGLIIEIVPNAHLKYFECFWLSKYSYEQELLFIGGLQPLQFVNITNMMQINNNFRELINWCSNLKRITDIKRYILIINTNIVLVNMQ